MSLELLLKSRAAKLKEVRSFFEKKRVLEVDAPLLVPAPSIDPNIDVMEVISEGYLHTSPEYFLKKLLVHGAPDLYFLGHVFRKGEKGKKHSPEFTMIEWYRKGFSLSQMIEETLELLLLFLPPSPIQTIAYKDLFARFLSLDIETQDPSSLLPSFTQRWSHSEKLDYLLTHSIEPLLALQEEIAVITDFPADQAALARLKTVEGKSYAERFEISFRGVELANGYWESSSAIELKERFEKENRERTHRGQAPYPMDELFLDAMARGLPDCSGVSVGFDRALMLHQQAPTIGEILPSFWIAR